MCRLLAEIPEMLPGHLPLPVRRALPSLGKHEALRAQQRAAHADQSEVQRPLLKSQPAW